MSSYDYNAAYGVAAGAMALYSIIGLALTVLLLVSLWKIFVKAGKPGWGAIVPFYNFYCLFDISFGNGWLFLLMFVPCVGVVMQIIAYVKLAQAFGKSGGFAVGLIFLPWIFLPIMAFDGSQYYGPA